MKSLKQVLEASMLEASLLDIDANMNVTDTDIIKSAITKFINDNYDCKKFTISNKPNKDGKFEVSTKYNVEVKNKSITSLANDLFIWNKIGGYFNCFDCSSLQSLEGSPKEVGGYFSCSYCSSLKSLEGAPNKVGDDFYCYNCKSLQSLKGAPKKVEESFSCYNCESLKSLEGAPKEVGNSFDCSNCKSLQSLEGAPKEVGGDFDCYNCKVQFEESDVRAVSNVKEEIIV